MTIMLLRRYLGREPWRLVIDDEDYARVAEHKWQVNFLGYVHTWIDGKCVYLHRFLMQPPQGMVVDHINGDKLDNRRCNLRTCTTKENVRNCHRSKNNTSGYPGVCRKRSGYRAYIMVDRKQINLGHYQTIEEAAAARKRGEQEYFGEFAFEGV